VAGMTRDPLPVITGAFCNEDQPLQAVITAPDCNQPLQDGHVITSNNPDHIESDDYSLSDSAVYESVDRESSYSYSGTNPCSDAEIGEGKPTRRPVMSRGERLWRLKDESKVRSPYTCPHCGSGALCPSFASDRRGTWICRAIGCGREFAEAD
jgi:hypothetical protein